LLSWFRDLHTTPPNEHRPDGCAVPGRTPGSNHVSRGLTRWA
jgi:hypothetical protein